MSSISPFPTHIPTTSILSFFNLPSPTFIYTLSLHDALPIYSCRNRHCPKCQGAAARKWLAEREEELLPVGYFHVVYTLPARLRDMAYQNKRVVYDLLMKAAAETTLTIAADPKRLGAKIGITA